MFQTPHEFRVKFFSNDIFKVNERIIVKFFEGK